MVSINGFAKPKKMHKRCIALKAKLRPEISTFNEIEQKTAFHKPRLYFKTSLYQHISGIDFLARLFYLLSSRFDHADMNWGDGIA